MWHELFHLTPSVLEKILRAVAVYVFLLVALRLGGKREMGQLNMMDFIVLLAVANAVQNGIIGNDNSITGAVIGATTLFVVNGAASMAAVRSPRARRILVGMPTILVVDGVVNKRNLRRERMSLDDLSQVVSEAGGNSVSEVQRCVIEPNGHVAVTLRQSDANAGRYEKILERLATLEDLVRKG
ncbi:MAG: hypothetical protein RLZZ544_107 [Actinomycetota bacterium]|nr:DUF421 domain-containing protein [Actinomycetota bacterium]